MDAAIHDRCSTKKEKIKVFWEILFFINNSRGVGQSLPAVRFVQHVSSIRQYFDKENVKTTIYFVNPNKA